MDNSVRRKKFLRKSLTAIATMCLVVSAGFIGADISDTASVKAASTSSTKSYSNKYNVVTTKKITFRKGAGSSYKAIKNVKKNTTFYVVQNSSGSWVKVKDSTGTAGYLPTRYLTKGSGSKITSKCRTSDTVNLRSGAGTGYNVLTVVPQNTTLSVSSNANVKWGKVKYSGKTGYISSDYAKYIYKIPTSSPKTTAVDQSMYFSSLISYVSTGNYYQNKLNCTYDSEISYTSSNTKVATVDACGVVYAKSNGTAVITAKCDKGSASYTVSVYSPYQSVNISNKNVTDNRGKSIYLTSSTSSVTWQSSDPSVASVSGGLVLCKKQGEAVISAISYSGESASCLVKVKGREAVRFTYADPNSSTPKTKVTFVAITDTLRTNVKFEVKKGDDVFNIEAESKKADGKTLVWKASKKLEESGTYSITAYSMYGDKWSKSPGSYAKAFITDAAKDTETGLEKRHASTKIVNFIAESEGYLSTAIFDPLLSYPYLTVGHGRVIFAGESFYNDLTKSEAYAYLVDSIENDGYVKKLNSFLKNNKIKCNQRQFDSLLSFSYNLGMNIFDCDSGLKQVLLAAYDDDGSRDLNMINKQNFIGNFLAYNRADNVFIPGLLYRRIDEAEIFFDGDYIHDGVNNKYGYSY